MTMFERAAAAWKIQGEEERAARAERELKRRAEFEQLLREITGATDFEVGGTGYDMSAEIEGLVFVEVG